MILIDGDQRRVIASNGQMKVPGEPFIGIGSGGRS
jgi:hypothetical protein